MPFTLLTLPDNGCRWPVIDDLEGVKGRHGFCGHPRVSPNPYCEAHRALACESLSRF
ncbi:GcrA family cell cycle regulator [Rhodoligotrophos appendicifer]|uniref:GcrA family cell cycle regulator n=1 Tax=Rhodoligotrophos appendicifer TaxID=987056 RepID=UPI00118627CD